MVLLNFWMWDVGGLKDFEYCIVRGVYLLDAENNYILESTTTTLTVPTVGIDGLERLNPGLNWSFNPERSMVVL